MHNPAGKDWTFGYRHHWTLRWTVKALARGQFRRIGLWHLAWLGLAALTAVTVTAVGSLTIGWVQPHLTATTSQTGLLTALIGYHVGSTVYLRARPWVQGTALMHSLTNEIDAIVNDHDYKRL